MSRNEPASPSANAVAVWNRYIRRNGPKRSGRVSCLRIDCCAGCSADGSWALASSHSATVPKSRPVPNASANPAAPGSASTSAPASGGATTAPIIAIDRRVLRNRLCSAAGMALEIHARLNGAYSAAATRATPASPTSHQTASGGRVNISSRMPTRLHSRIAYTAIITTRRDPRAARTSHGAARIAANPNPPIEPSRPICSVVAPNHSARPVNTTPSVA